jgi:predicted RNA binding protein YcfA (HicA-like mRNA interferase family)
LARAAGGGQCANDGYGRNRQKGSHIGHSQKALLS